MVVTDTLMITHPALSATNRAQNGGEKAGAVGPRYFMVRAYDCASDTINFGLEGAVRVVHAALPARLR